jgi:amino acid transporter
MVQVFLRQASGLVRTVSSRDVFIYNIGLINIGIGLAYIFILGPSFYPGASLWLGVAITTVFCVIQALTYYCFTTSMPRTGGEYVYISRSLHPALGFAMSMSMAIWLLFYTAWSAAAFANLGLSSIFGDLGVYFNSPTLTSWSTAIAGKVGSFIIGTIMIIFSTVLLAWGMEKYLKVQIWTFVVALVGVVILIIILAVSSSESFIAKFNAAAANIAGPNQYETVIAAAKKSEWTNPGFNWSSTLKFIVWPFYPLAFSIMSCSFAGEIKKVDKAQLLGMPGAVAFTGAVFILVTFLAQRVMGYDFLGAIGWNTYVAPEASTAATPWIHSLTALLTGNLLLKLLIGLGFLMWTYYWISGCMLYATRVAFSWSFDRLIPKVFGDVSPKYHTPVNSIILAGIIAEIFLILYSFTDWFQTLVGILAITFTFFFIGISAMVFPYTKKDLFESSPMNQRIAGVPLMSIFGFLTTVFMGYVIYLFFGDDIAAGNSTASLIAVFGPMTVAFIAYFIAQALRKSQGIDVSLAYKEIPVE